MKLLMVSQPTSAGVAVVVRQHVSMAVERGHEVVVACPPVERGPLGRWVVEAGATHIPIDMRRAPGLADLRWVLSLRALMREADLVLLHSSKAGAVGRIAAATMGRGRPPVVFTPHAWSWLADGRLAPVYRIIEKALLHVTDVIVAVGDAEARSGVAVLGASAPIRVVANGVDTTRFTPPDVGARRDGGLIVCVGRLGHQKGQDLAIRALARVADQTVRLRFVGDGDERESLEALAVRVGVSGRVEFSGFDDPLPHLRAADIVLLPSRWEGMSLALLEAMSCGAAIITTDVSGAEVLDGVGVVVPVEDVGAMVEAIDSLLADPDRRAELRRSARERAIEFDLSTSLDKTHDLWREVDRSSGPRSTK